MNLQSDITTIKGVGEKSAALFRKLHIEKVEDLLKFFPRDYEIFEKPLCIGDAPTDSLCTIRATVISAPMQKQVRALKILTLNVGDATGEVRLTFFNMPFLRNTLKKGQTFLFRGILRANRVMEQPRIYTEEEYVKFTTSIWPKYALTKGLSSQTIAKAVRYVLENCPLPKDILPEELVEKEGLMPYKEALRQIHFPKNKETLLLARKRLVFNEFFLFMNLLRHSKDAFSTVENTTPMVETAESKRFLESLPYRLTACQQKVAREIMEDLTGPYVMSRLLQGDVGSGKTIVAFYALLLCVSNGYQGAMMAPTEVLARQHFEQITKMTKEMKLPFTPVLLTGSQTAATKRKIYEEIESGAANLVIGTHAVIQDKVHFQNLVLVVTDEQHRFGVRQRDTLKEKGKCAHVLVMSATPIPRTLAIILYGDLKISIMDELPGGRKQIKNCVVGTQFRKKAYEFIYKEVTDKHQVYCICPMVEEGETEGLENVSDYTEKLKSVLPESFTITALHGKMKPAEKNRIMEEFSKGNIDVLVSTTVIEVGINVPNATVMLIENAERFGLAQLHQLRGRVGRGDAQSYCIFMYGNESENTKKRLEILNHSNDGFYIAEEDLKLRGPGDLFGIRQSGDFRFVLGDIYQDADVLKQASDCMEKYKDILPEISVDFGSI